MSGDRLAIGAFSRASSISVGTLRLYHDMGLLIPGHVDRLNGYRYYTVDQLADALVVVRLRALDVPLASIKQILDSRDPALTRQLLDEHRAVMQERLSDTERIVATLQHGIATAGTPVHVRHEPAMLVAQVAAEVPGAGLWNWLGRTHAHLADIAGAHTAVTGPRGALYTPEIIDEINEQVVAFVPIESPFLVPAHAPDVTIGEIAPTSWAVLVHTDGFDSIGETYRLLGAWVARNANPTGAAICERYHPPVTAASSRPDSAPDDGPIEICWPIESTRDP